MKRAILPILMMALLCACGSTGGQKEKFESWRQELDSVSVTALVTISQEQQTASYELRCDWTPESSRVEVLSPETIAGVTASRTGGDTRLEYDGLILGLGELGDISPVSALPELLDAIHGGYAELCYEETMGDEKGMGVQFSPDNGVTVRLWLDKQMRPVHADFSQDGSADITVSVTDWSME